MRSKDETHITTLRIACDSELRRNKGKGVQGAIDEQKGFEINPNEKEAEIQTIKFSISLSTETKAEAGIKVLSAAHDTTSLNKIDFEVKMRLPKTHKEGIPKPKR